MLYYAILMKCFEYTYIGIYITKFRLVSLKLYMGSSLSITSPFIPLALLIYITILRLL